MAEVIAKKSRPLLIAGLPGSMSTLLAEAAIRAGFRFCRESLTGEGQPKTVTVAGRTFNLIPPDDHSEYLESVSQVLRDLPIVVDFTQPSAAVGNAGLYCQYGFPFVMGTTGGDKAALEKLVVGSGNIALLAPNLALPVVALQRFMDRFSQRYEGRMKGFYLKIIESHQQKKKDPSGTARTNLEYFKRLGMDVDEKILDGIKLEGKDKTVEIGPGSNFTMIREPDSQRKLGVPEAHLNGHGWHTYTISAPAGNTRVLEEMDEETADFILGQSRVFQGYGTRAEQPFYSRFSPDGNVSVGFKSGLGLGGTDFSVHHNICGRRVYADGGITLIGPFEKRIDSGQKGKLLTTLDLLNDLKN